MKKLTATLCLTITILLGTMGISVGADFQKGLDAYRGNDFAAALREWKPLAERGDASAQYYLGVLYENGGSVPQDHKTAVKWYRLAAEQGNANAQFKLSMMYALGRGVILDWIYAHMWGNLAASNKKDKKLSRLLDLAVTQMNPSQLEIAQKLARECVRNEYRGCDNKKNKPNIQTGIWAYTTSKDYVTALRNLKPLAEEGNARAQYYLGRMYAFGNGVQKDSVRAYMWADLSEINGEKYKGPRLINLLEKRKEMTPAQIEKTLDLSDECIRKKYKGC